MCKWYDKVVDGVEVYQVGKQQLWDWCGFDGTCRELCNIGSGASLTNFGVSLAKGRYVLVEMAACFGHLLGPRIESGFTSLKAAVEYVTWIIKCVGDVDVQDCYYHGYRFQPFVYEYEIWHIVDDGDLWHEWECRSAQYVALNCDLDEHVVLQSEYLTLDAFRAMDPEHGDIRYQYSLGRLFHFNKDYETLSRLQNIVQEFADDDDCIASIGIMPGYDPIVISS